MPSSPASLSCLFCSVSILSSPSHLSLLISHLSLVVLPSAPVLASPIICRSRSGAVSVSALFRFASSVSRACSLCLSSGLRSSDLVFGLWISLISCCFAFCTCSFFSDRLSCAIRRRLGLCLLFSGFSLLSHGPALSLSHPVFGLLVWGFVDLALYLSHPAFGSCKNLDSLEVCWFGPLLNNDTVPCWRRGLIIAVFLLSLAVLLSPLSCTQIQLNSLLVGTRQRHNCWQ